MWRIFLSFIVFLTVLPQAEARLIITGPCHKNKGIFGFDEVEPKLEDIMQYPRGCQFLFDNDYDDNRGRDGYRGRRRHTDFSFYIDSLLRERWSRGDPGDDGDPQDPSVPDPRRPVIAPPMFPKTGSDHGEWFFPIDLREV